MLFRWEDVDHSFAGLRLLELSIEMNQLIKADERRIRFEQRGNQNGNTVPSFILQLQQDRADEWAHKTYDIYCDVWQKQGYPRSAAFLRAVFTHGIRTVLHARARAIAAEFTMFAVRTAFPTALTQAHLRGLDLNMRRMEERWRRRLEIEAKECEHAEASARRSLAAARDGHASVTTILAAEAPRRAAAVAPRHESKATKPGPRPKRSGPFMRYAAELWRNARSDGGTVPAVQLQSIASALDAAKYLPPAEYLEGKYARELKDFNRKNSNSKPGALLTWSRLVLYGDKDHLQGMRRLLSRCAGNRR